MVNSDVVVVGAGIGGAVLALSLGTRGWKVKLLEREAQPVRMARPEILWSPTPAALDRFGIGDAIRDQASVRLSQVAATVGSRSIISLSPDVFARAGKEAYSTDPGMTRQLIADAAIATGNVEIVRGVTVHTVLRHGGRIVGVEATQGGAPLVERARLVVGDDGAHSIVRAAILSESHDMKLNVFSLAFVTAAIRWPEALPRDQIHVWLNPPGFREGIPAVACFPWPAACGVLLMPMPHDRAERLLKSPAEAFWTELAKVSPLAQIWSAQLSFPGDFRSIQRPFGHAPRYVADGAAIIGDAAHPVSPAGGQGANAAIWDALALADVADDALQAGDLSRQSLKRYETLRRPRNRASVRITERTDRALHLGSYIPGVARLVPLILQGVDRMPSVKARFLSSIATTFVTRH